jgi:hypothetical protein
MTPRCQPAKRDPARAAHNRLHRYPDNTMAGPVPVGRGPVSRQARRERAATLLRQKDHTAGIVAVSMTHRCNCSLLQCRAESELRSRFWEAWEGRCS